MLAPSVPGNTPDVGYPSWPALGFVNGGPSPAVEQASRLRAHLAGQALTDRAAGGHLFGRAANVYWGDRPSPQLIPVNVRITTLAAGAAVGIESTNLHLPGRLSPAAWDGELGQGSPPSTGV
jgi:hypothetical protein